MFFGGLNGSPDFTLGVVMDFKIRNALANAEDELLYAQILMRSSGECEVEIAELQTAIDSIKRVRGS